jgi:hypothetical protein
MKYWITFTFTLVYFTLFFSINAQIKPNEDTLKFTYKRYTIKKFASNTDKWHMEVYQEGSKVFGLEAPKAGHLQYVSINGITTYDIDQDGHANLVLQKYLDNEKEEVAWYILSLEANQFKKIDEIHSMYGTPWLADYEGDGTFEIIIKEYTFANWNASFLDSPYQTLPLRFISGSYQPALDLMKKELPQDLEEKAGKIKQALTQFYQKSKATYPYEVNVLAGEVNQRWSFIPVDLWATLLHLYYTGNGQETASFLDQSWYEPLEGKAAFWQDFQQQASLSAYWQTIQNWNMTSHQAEVEK